MELISLGAGHTWDSMAQGQLPGETNPTNIGMNRTQTNNQRICSGRLPSLRHQNTAKYTRQKIITIICHKGIYLKRILAYFIRPGEAVRKRRSLIN